MTPARLSADELRALEARTGIALRDDEREAVLASIDIGLAGADRVAELAAALPGATAGRDPGRAPREDENPHGAWVWRCSLRSPGAEGVLSGRTVALKDNVAVAGMPLTGGSALLRGFVPTRDATIVMRILDAGGEIAGKAACEALCVSGGSHTSFPGPVRNPRSPAHMAGGSSSGSAALVAAGAVDLAVGGDQAGSIRIPASWCGVVGLKPTRGLVPYTGILPLDPAIDHAGPMAADVAGVAVLLEAMAGRDGVDPRQSATPADLPRYAAAAKPPASLTIGVVPEGFGWPGVSDPAVDAAVRAALERLAAAGASLRPVSVPWHRDGVHVWSAIATEGVWSGVVRDHLAGYGIAGPHEPDLAAAFAEGLRRDPDGLPPGARVLGLLGAHLAATGHGRTYAQGLTLREPLRLAYDEALDGVDVLAMPTTCWGPPLLEEDVPPAELARRTVGPIENTCPFDVTGHPAISVPCGTAGGLPVGLMLVGRTFGDAGLLGAAAFAERALA